MSRTTLLPTKIVLAVRHLRHNRQQVLQQSRRGLHKMQSRDRQRRSNKRRPPLLPLRYRGLLKIQHHNQMRRNNQHLPP